ncbi:MAG: hypothetical protein ACRDSH_03905 [Pseudonocardiaceae bacterium]
MIADSSALATFVGEQIRLVWPADYDLRRIALHDPTPVYPHSLIWRSANPHSAPTSAPRSPTTPTPRPGHRNGRNAQHHQGSLVAETLASERWPTVTQRIYSFMV